MCQFGGGCTRCYNVRNLDNWRSVYVIYTIVADEVDLRYATPVSLPA